MDITSYNRGGNYNVEDIIIFVLAMGIIGLSSISRQQVYAKENLPEMDEESLTYNYTGEDITVHELDDLYKNKGTVYYKMGENGTWSTELPKVKDIGNVELEYYVLGNDNYYDLSSQDLPESITIKVEVRKDNWGRKIEENGYEYYVDERSIASTEVKAGSLIWLKETSYGTSA